MIHTTAVVDSTAELAPDVEVGALAYIGPHCILHEKVKIGAKATVECYSEIGAGTCLSPNAHVGGAPQDISYKDEATRLKIGENCVIREFSTIHRASVKDDWLTEVGDNCYVMASAHIAHDCKVGNNVTLAGYSALSGHVRVDEHVFISGLVGIHQFVRIGVGAMVSAVSRTGKDVLPYCIALDDAIVSLNIVGMRRRGFSAQLRTEIKKAVHIFTNKSLLLTEVKEKLTELEQYPEIIIIRNFIENSKRGIIRNANWTSEE
ncbi:MAG: acyl-ACP--UDP-N-acetylglucosamine O-acyltransferase [Deferribacteraceae bacterium]|jgi:UDP-N-acetylglucosamine acyltransferase|nr:acyl-ACP--UDP-N-acetylglucosamine O-acyltransferase [Deferribacteraceae bacterium]